MTIAIFKYSQTPSDFHDKLPIFVVKHIHHAYNTAHFAYNPKLYIIGSGSSSTVAFFYTNNFLCTMTMWASWMCGQLVMPIDGTLPFQEQLNLLKLGNTHLLISTATNGQLASKLAYELDIPVLILDHLFIEKKSSPFNFKREVFISSNSVVVEGMLANDFYSTKDAFLLPTINIHGQQRLVVLSHRNLCNQLESLANSLQLRPEDRLINVLSSSKQINGYINATLTPFTVGGTLHTFEDPFDAPRCWSMLLGINAQQRERPNILLTEPDVYRQLIAEYDKIFLKDNRMVEFIKNYCQKNFRLMLCNFGPLSNHLMDRWQKITGHLIMNMYYMAETGMIFYNRNTIGNEESSTLTKSEEVNATVEEESVSNIPTNGIQSRSSSELSKRSSPLSIWNVFHDTVLNVRVRIVDSHNNIVVDKNDSDLEITTKDGDPCGTGNTQLFSPKKNTNTTIIGNLQVSGPGLFRCYLREKSDDEFFNTGLIVAYENGTFKMLGRSKCLNTSMIDSSEEVNNSTDCNDPFPELSNQFCLHPAIDYIHIKEEGIVCGIKAGRELSLDNLKCFHAFIYKDYERAVRFNLIKVKENQ